MEYAHLLAAAGHGPESVVAYRQILINSKEKTYSLPEPTIATFYLGNALRDQHRFQEAAKTYDSVGSCPGAGPELIQRAVVSAGEMYDTLQKRDLAVQRYQTVLSANNKTVSADLAREHLKQPFQFK